MKEYKAIRSTMQPEPKVIDDFSVWIASNIAPVEEPEGENEARFNGYQYDLTQYTKDEYIKLMDDKNESLGTEITNTQLALCDVYELLG